MKDCKLRAIGKKKTRKLTRNHGICNDRNINTVGRILFHLRMPKTIDGHATDPIRPRSYSGGRKVIDHPLSVLTSLLMVFMLCVRNKYNDKLPGLCLNVGEVKQCAERS